MSLAGLLNLIYLVFALERGAEYSALEKGAGQKHRARFMGSDISPTKLESLESELEQISSLQTALIAKANYLQGEHYAKKIEVDEKPLAKETVPALASMLGEMRTEMHEYVSPFYIEQLRDQISEIEARKIEIKWEVEGNDPTNELQPPAQPKIVEEIDSPEIEDTTVQFH